MPALRESLEALGLRDVRAYTKSGNVVFSSPKISPETLAAGICERIRSDFAFAVPVMVRTNVDLRRIVSSNPFLLWENDLTRLHATFPDGVPPDAAIAQLDRLTFPPDDPHVQRPRQRDLHPLRGYVATRTA